MLVPALSILGAILLGSITTGQTSEPAAAYYRSIADNGPVEADGYFQTIERLTDRVWIIRQPRFQPQPIGNVVVVEQADGLVMIDAGGSRGAGERLVGLVRSVSDKPVRAIVLTGWHGDKTQGLTALLQAWPDARTISTETTRRHLMTPRTMNTPGAPDPVGNAAMQAQIRGLQEFVRSQMSVGGELQGQWAGAQRLLNQYALDMDGTLTIPTTESFTDRLSLDDAVAPVELVFMGRGNSDGDAVVWLPTQRVIVTGDLVVMPFPYAGKTYPSEWIAVLEQIKAYDFEMLVPGHGLPQRDAAYIDLLIAGLRDVLDRVRGAATEGADLPTVRRAVNVSHQAALFGVDDPWVQLWFGQFWAGPIVADAYREVRGEPTVQSLR